ncbi:MAG: type I 3-dehydroquinate dehydratase [Treponema sp.]|nr:type I 3-dehydroquinate dehydratase [Treponema sp.]
MKQPLICLTLTGKTLEEDAALVRKYNQYIDLAELRVDFLEEEEQLYVRRFPSMVNIPCVLTIRRKIDGGLFFSGEISRTMLFGRALAFADQNPTKNFAYVDFEEDYHIPSLQDAALAFGVRIIRSCHDMEKPITNLKALCNEMRKTGYEIPKIAFMPTTLADVTNLFKESESITEYDHILCAMGPLGQVSRILSYKLNSYLTYTSPEETNSNIPSVGHLDPVTLNNVYHFRDLNEHTTLYGITGWPLVKTSSPEIHNSGYKAKNINAVFIPVRSPSITDVLDFSRQIGIQGLAVTIPHKETVLAELAELDQEAGEIGASNTVVRKNSGWAGYNTDAYGFRKALTEFLGTDRLRHRRVAILGAGGAAKAVAYVIKQLGARACIFNRTVSNAKVLAERYGFEYALLDVDSVGILEQYSDIIIQTTSKGMNTAASSNKENDPVYFYQFHGNEKLFDIIYVPEITPVMMRAAEAGCKVCNGMKMLKYQGYRQFKIFTGVDYEGSDTK